MEILLVLMGVVCGVFWYVCRAELASRQVAEEKWVRESMLAEAESVIMDFLDYGKEVSLATRGKYRGILSVRLHPVDKKGALGLYISMYDSGNLNQLSPAALERYHLEKFIKKYGYYYDAERDAIVYQTSRSTRLAAEERAVLLKGLFCRIENHPLAMVMSDTVIHTRGI